MVYRKSMSNGDLLCKIHTQYVLCWGEVCYRTNKQEQQMTHVSEKLKNKGLGKKYNTPDNLILIIFNFSPHLETKPVTSLNLVALLSQR